MVPLCTLAYMFELIENHASELDLPWYQAIPNNALVRRCWWDISPEQRFLMDMQDDNLSIMFDVLCGGRYEPSTYIIGMFRNLLV